MVSTTVLFLKSFPSKTSFACQESKGLNILKSTLQALNIHFILREDFNQLQVYNLKIQLIQQCEQGEGNCMSPIQKHQSEEKLSKIPHGIQDKVKEKETFFINM